MLVPDDPVFFAKFQSLEEPLLRRLHLLHSAGRESDDERVVADAYESWVRILLKLPLWPQWQVEDVSGGPAQGGRTGYTLYDPRGHQLTCLYPIEVTAADLGCLAACLDLFVEDDKGRRAVPDASDSERPERDGNPVDVFRRVMDVLLLPPPRRLLGVLREFLSQGTGVSVTLQAEQEAQYRCFCEEIVTILSSGDTFAYRSHRAIYL
ncbi:hypothetical protein [Streptomyces sp. NPDC001020]